MVTMVPVELEAGTAIGLQVELPSTRLLCITTPRGYVMCGVLAVELLDQLHPERGIVAARVIGVRTVPDLLEATVDAATRAAQALGIKPGMTGREALNRMLSGEASA